MKAMWGMNLLALLWILVLLAAIFLMLNFMGMHPDLRDVVMIAFGVILAIVKDIGQFIWRKRPEVK